jgi:YesN/AraC family two-component response regulator
LSELNLSHSGYVCAPYLHNRDSLELKEIWTSSRNIEKLFFVTGTFSDDSQPYFSTSANHYLLAKFKDNSVVEKELSKHIQEKTSFVFNMHDNLFEREVLGTTNFISIYYLEYGDDDDDLQEIAGLLLKREKIEVAGIGNMVTLCSISSKFTFPYSKNMVIIEVASEKSHQSVKKYCDQTQRDVNRKGFTLSNLLSLSILDQLK